MVYKSFELLEMFPDTLITSSQRYTAPWIVRGIFGCRLMQPPKKVPERNGCHHGVRWREQRTLTVKPGYYRPSPGKPTAGTANADGRRNQQGQSRAQSRKPPLLLFD